MTKQEIAEIISPAQNYLNSQAQYALDTFITPSFKGIPGNRVRKSNLEKCEFKPLEKLRADISANLEIISNTLDTERLSQDEIDEKSQGLSIGYEQIGFILSVELMSKVIKDILFDDKYQKRHLPSGHAVHIISKLQIVEHVKNISDITGNYHLNMEDIQYDKVPELNSHPSCLIGSIGRVALIHHIPEIREHGSSLFITPVGLLQKTS